MTFSYRALKIIPFGRESSRHTFHIFYIFYKFVIGEASRTTEVLLLKILLFLANGVICQQLLKITVMSQYENSEQN